MALGDVAQAIRDGEHANHLGVCGALRPSEGPAPDAPNSRTDPKEVPEAVDGKESCSAGIVRLR